jgi:hypothetical protein
MGGTENNAKMTGWTDMSVRAAAWKLQLPSSCSDICSAWWLSHQQLIIMLIHEISTHI